MKIGIVSADRTEPTGMPRNIGDAALTESLREGLLGLPGVREVIIGDAGSPALRKGGSERVPIQAPMQLLRFVRSVDVVVIGGGTLLQDDQPTGLGGLPRLVAITALAARVMRRRLWILCVGAEPVSRRYGRALLHFGIHASHFVSVREVGSQRLLADSYHRQPHLGADAIWLRSRAAPPTSNANDGLLIALNRNEVPLISNALLSSLRERFGKVQLLSMDQSDRWDFQTLSDLDEVLPPTNGPEEVWAAVAEARYVLATRMHMLYFAAMLDKPAASIESSAKVKAYSEEFGIPYLLADDLAKIQPETFLRPQTQAVDRARQRAFSALRNALSKTS